MKYILRRKKLMGMSTLTKLLYRKLFCKFYAIHRHCYNIVKSNHNYDCDFIFIILWVFHHEIYLIQKNWVESNLRCDEYRHSYWFSFNAKNKENRWSGYIPEAFFLDPLPLPRDDVDWSSGLIGSFCHPLLSRPLWPPTFRLPPPAFADGTDVDINVRIIAVDQHMNKQLYKLFMFDVTFMNSN